MTTKVKKDERVKRVNGKGGQGTVLALREEVGSTGGDKKQPPIMVEILWDNGTRSYLGPEAVEKV